MLLYFLLFDLSTVNISWSPPFALPSTSVAEYNISVTSIGTTTNYFTSNSYFVLQLSNITDSPCNEINVTVSRYNTVSGIISMPVITFYPPSGTVCKNFVIIYTILIHWNDAYIYACLRCFNTNRQDHSSLLFSNVHVQFTIPPCKFL